MYGSTSRTEAIKDVACVGSGAIGSSWALLFALKDHNVTVLDLDDDILRRSLEAIKAMLNPLVQAGVVKKGHEEGVLNRIRFTREFADVGRADYVQESVAERIETKVDVMQNIERHVGGNTLIASSTSTLSMTRMQQTLRNPERAVVAHPFNPPHLLPLVEIVPGEKTSEEAVRTVWDFMVQLGKAPIMIKKEVPGFAANRIQIAMLREVLDLLNCDVVSMEDIEKIFFYGLGLRYAFMGPFAIETINGGPGGLRDDLNHFRPAFEEMLCSLSTWTTFPSSAQEKALAQIGNLECVKGKSYIELLKWRDAELIGLLRHFGYTKAKPESL